MVSYPTFSKELHSDIQTAARRAKKFFPVYQSLPDLEKISFFDWPAYSLKELYQGARRHKETFSKKIHYVYFSHALSGEMILNPIPHYTDEFLSGLNHAVKRHNPKMVLGIGNATMLVEHLLYNSLRDSGLPVCTIPPNNLPLGRFITRELDIEGVVTNPSIANAFLIELQTRDEKVLKTIKFWHLISSFFERKHDVLDLPGQVFLEQHLEPGRTLLYQCETLAKKNSESQIFHPSPNYFWQILPHAIIITSLRDEAFPLIRCALPPLFSFRQEPCACGASIYAEYA